MPLTLKNQAELDRFIEEQQARRPLFSSEHTRVEIINGQPIVGPCPEFFVGARRGAVLLHFEEHPQEHYCEQFVNLARNPARYYVAARFILN